MPTITNVGVGQKPTVERYTMRQSIESSAVAAMQLSTEALKSLITLQQTLTGRSLPPGPPTHEQEKKEGSSALLPITASRLNSIIYELTEANAILKEILIELEP